MRHGRQDGLVGRQGQRRHRASRAEAITTSWSHVRRRPGDDLDGHPFSTDHDKSFAGLAIGRFSAAPACGAARPARQDSDCTGHLQDNVCEISGFACTANGDCHGLLHVIRSVLLHRCRINYNLQIATFLMAHSVRSQQRRVHLQVRPVSTAPKQQQLLTVDNFVQPAIDRAFEPAACCAPAICKAVRCAWGHPTVVRINGDPARPRRQRPSDAGRLAPVRPLHRASSVVRHRILRDARLRQPLQLHRTHGGHLVRAQLHGDST